MVYDENDLARFASNTAGTGRHITFQADGNVAIYDAGPALCATNTAH